MSDDAQIIGWLASGNEGEVMSMADAINLELDALLALAVSMGGAPGELPDKLELCAYRKRPPIVPEQWADRVIDDLWERLDEEHAGREGEGAEQPVSDAVREAARTFLRIVSAEYEPWLLDLDHREEIDVADWLRDASPGEWELLGCRIGDAKVIACTGCDGEGTVRRVCECPPHSQAEIAWKCDACAGAGWALAPWQEEATDG